MALHLRLKPHSHHPPLPSLRLFSSSPFPPPPPPSDESPPESQSQSQSQSNVSSYFRDIKQRLGSPSSPPHRIPTEPLPPPSFFKPQSQKPAASLEEIRKSLANFRLNSPSSSSSSPPSSFSPPKFQDILKTNLQNNPPGSGSPLSFESIRQNLRQSRSSNDSFFNLKSLQESIRNRGPQTGAPPGSSVIGSDSQLPEGIFGREARERDGEEGEKESNEFAHFTKEYTHQELGEKLVRLRPEGGEKKKEGFSLNELNQRLVKLRKLEVEEAKLNDSPFSFIKETLYNIQNQDAQKRVQRTPILTSLGGLVTPKYMYEEPQEQLLEKYFHPDHMSSAEKMKLQLKKVRDEFKMSESDCGSARVQVAQLTTKIKHLSSVLNKKDKHSIKGLQEMVQRRKKLLKYLRRTDWDSYCLVLSKLGLRDIPEYKAPDYKTFHQIKPKSKSKNKKSKGRARMKA
ncbi:uncharacterized protein LOC144548117 [Carex rostrata]